ncbi:MAG: hypothetical protein AAGI53_15070 [Planctomycetota bacterium]
MMTDPRRIWRVAVCAGMGIGLLTQATSAAEPGVPVVSAQPGNVTMADMNAFAEVYWHFVDTGELLPDADTFSPSNPGQVGANHLMFYDAYLLFEDLYAQQLDDNPDSPNYYTLDDLFRDDPAALSQFRTYTLTGTLGTGLLSSPITVVENHMKMVANAAAADGCYDVASVDLAAPTNFMAYGGVSNDLMLVSQSLQKKKKAPCPGPGPGPGPEDEPDELPDILDDPIDDFPFRQWFPVEILDMPDGWWTPGFDCDDWADVLAEYLRRQLEGENFEIYQLWLTWYGDGHVVTVICLDGKYYVTDAQTGSTRGPYDSLEDAYDGAWDIMEQDYDVDRDDQWFPDETLRDPEERPFGEPGPWHENPDVREPIEDAPNLDPDDYIPPSSQ